jgi:hypothetical protein
MDPWTRTILLNFASFPFASSASRAEFRPLPENPSFDLSNQFNIDCDRDVRPPENIDDIIVSPHTTATHGYCELPYLGPALARHQGQSVF